MQKKFGVKDPNDKSQEPNKVQIRKFNFFFDFTFEFYLEFGFGFF